MYKILIVEDNYEKLKKITSCLDGIEGINLDTIQNVVDARSAKEKLKASCFDMLILDIAIPTRINEDVMKSGGIDLLQEVFERDIYKIPLDIICVTAYDDIYTEEKEYLDSQLIPFIYCRSDTDGWMNQIKKRTERNLLASVNRRYHSEEYESFVSIICALESPELEAVLENGWKWEQISVQNDPTIYYRGLVKTHDKSNLCYAAAAPRKGMPATAVLASKMITLFQPTYIAMLGITSGCQDRTNMGDVIIADPAWDWGSGKIIENDGVIKLESEPHQLDLEVGIRNKFKLLLQETSVLSAIRKGWRAEVPKNEITVRIGPLASGAAVLADGKTRLQILNQHRGLLGVDMETYALFEAAQEALIPRPNVFAMKSVVDFADGEKDDRYQKYASYVSARVFKYFVESLL